MKQNILDGCLIMWIQVISLLLMLFGLQRESEVHFISEEIPKTSTAWFRGSRYFHAIYNCSNQKIIHLDGAIRIYSVEEVKARNNCHVKDIGKIGKRIKIFQINRELELED